jgi:hypothetical protein
MSNPIMHFAKSTTAIESGFIAAGLTVSIGTVLVTLLNWIIFSV